MESLKTLDGQVCLKNKVGKNYHYSFQAIPQGYSNKKKSRYWHKIWHVNRWNKTARHVNQWNKTEDPHMSTGSYSHLILTEMSKKKSREKIASSKKWYWENWKSTYRIILDPHLLLCTHTHTHKKPTSNIPKTTM